MSAKGRGGEKCSLRLEQAHESNIYSIDKCVYLNECKTIFIYLLVNGQNNGVNGDSGAPQLFQCSRLEECDLWIRALFLLCGPLHLLAICGLA